MSEGSRQSFTFIFLNLFILSCHLIIGNKTPTFSYPLILDIVIKAGGASVIGAFAILEGVDIVGWLTEFIKRQHRKEGLEEGIEKGRADYADAVREWYEYEVSNKTLGTARQSPPPFKLKEDGSQVYNGNWWFPTWGMPNK